MSDDRFVFTTNKSHNGAYLVYINGIEVPTISVQVRYGVWQIPECNIAMVPDPVLVRLGDEDRVQVAVFFIDDFNPQPNEEPAVPRLLMDGEITGWGYQNTPSGRAISFTVINQIAILTQLFIHFLQSLDDLTAHATAPEQDVNAVSSVQNELVFPYTLFSMGLNPSKDADKITRPFDFAYNLVRSMTSTAVPKEHRAIPAANFFTRWARLTNFINRFVATPIFDETSLPGGTNPHIFPALRALQSQSVIELITHNLIAPVQNSGSMWDVLQLVLQTLFTELVMLPTAPLVNVKLDDSTIQPTKRSEHSLVTGSKGATPAKDPIPGTPKRLANYFVKPQLIFGLPPSCNVLFPSQIQMYTYNENYATQPTRLYFNDEVLNRLVPSEGSLGQTVLDALAIAYPEEANAHSVARRHVAGNANGKNFLLFPEEFFKGPVMDRRPMPNVLFFMKMNEFRDAKTRDDAAKRLNVLLEKSQQAQALPNGDPTPTIEKLYAEYEFYRERYSRRTGGAMLKGFQPFIVPGFPCAIFDNKATHVDVFGYVTTVTHTLSARGGMSTQMTFTYGRTFEEVLDKLSEMYETSETMYAMAPREPISEVRLTVQEFDKAEEFYNALFYGRTTYAGKTASFKWNEVVGYAPDATHKVPEVIFMQGTTESQVKSVSDAKVAIAQANEDIEKKQLEIATVEQAYKVAVAIIARADSESVDVDAAKQDRANSEAELTRLYPELAELQDKLSKLQAIVSANEQQSQTSKVFSNVTGGRPLQPLPAFADAFQNYDDAMRYNWRPICSLDEYITFYNSVGEGEIPAFNHPRSIGARYYERIRRLVPYDPNKTPVPPNADGVTPTPAVQAPGSTQQAHPVVTGLNKKNFAPQTRTDWDAVLTAYRNNVYNVKAPRG